MRTMQKASDMRKPTISSVRGAIKLHGNDLSSGKLLVPFLIAVLHFILLFRLKMWTVNLWTSFVKLSIKIPTDAKKYVKPLEPNTPRMIMHSSERVAWTIRNLVCSSIPIQFRAFLRNRNLKSSLVSLGYTGSTEIWRTREVSLQTNQFCSIFLIELAKKREERRPTVHVSRIKSQHILWVSYSLSFFPFGYYVIMFDRYIYASY